MTLAIKDNPPSKTFSCSVSEKCGTWWVANVKSKHEKSFAFDLIDMQIDYYLPYVEKKTLRSDGKTRKSYLILFPSYVPFIADNPYKVLKTQRVLSILPVVAQSTFRNQLECISKVTTSGINILPTEINHRFQNDDIVVITCGQFKGLEGKIVDIKNERYLLFPVESMGCAMVCVSNDHVALLQS